MHRFTSGVLLMFLATTAPAWSQDAWSRDPRIPAGIRAGFEANRDFELQRRAGVGAQVNLNAGLRAVLGWSSPYDQTIYYSHYYPQQYYPYSYDYYGYYAYPSYYAGAVGYAYAPPIRQPIGQRQEQTGPNRWESYPMYGDELPAMETRVVAPAVESVPIEEVPAVEPPRPEPPPPAPRGGGPRRSGPREF